MSDRGESSFLKLPRFAAKMYDKMMHAAPIQIQITQIAEYLLKVIEKGRLLDIGTGHGRLLLEINSINPLIELYGLDISKAMISIAQKNLEGIKVDLEVGNIQKAPYESNFFDLITCTGSFYLWNLPEKGLEEIFRILKKGFSAYLFETHKDYDENELKKAIQLNLKDENFFYRKVIPRFLKKQLKMTHEIEELEQIIKATSFKRSYAVEKIVLANLPIWLCIKLTKQIFD